MSASYRKNVAAKATHDRHNADKKRLLQLTVSLVLFCIVFFCQGTFPALEESLEHIIYQDMTFDMSIQEIWSNVLKKRSDESVRPETSAEPEREESTEIEQIQVTPLSQTEQLGLLYYQEHGLWEPQEETQVQVEVPDEAVVEPEIVTAVAQPFNERGESLPRNVSYEQYELGLEKTVVPVFGEVTSGFDYRISPISGQREFHLALDIAAPKGTPIGAFADGVVRYIGESDDFGLYLMIDHDNGVATFYAHCSKLLVHKGDKVTCGETVALVGDTGNATGHHLHFTIEKDNIRLNPAYYVDPKV